MKVGIIGNGFVGSAIMHGFVLHVDDIMIYDKDKKRSTHSISDVANKSDVIFICVPTPMFESGECDLSIVKSSLHNLDLLAGKKQCEKPIVIIKSTVPPGTTEKLNKLYSNLEVIFSPEFLTEANHIEDFKNQTRIILGGTRPATTKVKTMFRKAFPKIPIVKTG